MDSVRQTSLFPDQHSTSYEGFSVEHARSNPEPDIANDAEASKVC